MSLKVRLISVLALFMLMLGILIMGVFAASQQLTLNGSINFNIQDRSLYVKDVRIKHDMSDSQPQSIDAFTPGYINQGFALDLKEISQTNTYGSFTLYFDVINTTESMWEIKNVTLPTTLEDQGVFVSGFGGRVEVNDLTDADNDGYKEITNIETAPYSTLTISISNPNASAENPLVLDGISITIDEYVPPTVTTTAIGEDATETNLGLAISEGYAIVGDEVTLTADFTGTENADFLGWKTSADATEYISTLPNYTFTFDEASPTTYYAVFTEPEELLSYTYNTPATGEARLVSCLAGATDITVPSAIYRTDEIPMEYTVTSMYDSSSSSSGVFYQTRSTLQSISLPETLTNIGRYAFRLCSGLTSITIPEEVISIGDRAFQGCSGLTSLIIPSSVTSIGHQAFRDCSGLESITVEAGNSVYHSSGNCLIETDSKTLIAGCKNLVIPTDGSVTSIGSYAFSGASGLTNITIPSSVTSIGDYAFNNCSGLTGDLVIPEDVISIGQGAFSDCSSLTSITIPEGVTSIGSKTFRFCSNLTSITIPEGVTSIGDSAFEYCSGLTNITIPSSVTSIGSYAFDGCNGLTSITINRTTPPTLGSGVFSYTNNAPIYVPAGAVETYKAADGWSNYADRISAIPTT